MLRSFDFLGFQCWKVLGKRHFPGLPGSVKFYCYSIATFIQDSFLISDLLKLLFKISLSSSHLAMLIFLLCSGRRISHAAVDLVEEGW